MPEATPSDQGTRTASDPELDRLVLEQKKAEARKATAEARKAELSALLPDLKVDVPAETLDAGDKGSALSELLAYAELDPASVEIVKRIDADIGNTLKGSRVLLVRTFDLAGEHGAHITLRSFQATLKTVVSNAIARLEKPRVELREDFAPPILAAVGLALSALPTVLSLMRSNRTVRGRDFALAASAVIAALSSALRKAGAEVIVAGFTTVPENQVIVDIRELQEQRNRLADLQADWQIKEVDRRSVELARDIERLTSLYKKRDEKLASNPPQPTDVLDKEIETLRSRVSVAQTAVASAKLNVDLAQRLVNAVDTFVTSIHIVPAGRSAAPIVTAALWHEFFSTDAAARFVLFAEAAFGGGESQYEERAMRNDKAQYIGGVALTYLLTDKDGLTRSSGVVSRLVTTNHTMGSASYERHSGFLDVATPT